MLQKWSKGKKFEEQKSMVGFYFEKKFFKIKQERWRN